ncbi:MAG: lipoprotein-releasing ABC transporter permease subunit [Rhodospirillales bacterium]|jgi:lipoprotein-releasing system permease protein|nr:lipoprotein-releasing system transmembrane subunit LolC [Rhodospirillaceae bacterium]MDP6427594.1 lipoprotein-releasing ABC transporter permease subunit [Rhodospirillales bacterium]MDP6643490.1 lipoprotein-releasing ABC transporter permease subunit [Rhodospirillales bacterium]MDP6842582.1 lipoprotein-releasing ABC transporter permease subunit [Rhodospirillales bacterium]
MFSAFEWMMAMRYLRARRQEGFISVIAWFSLLGIGLGVATLIIVMSVMNGFRQELLTRILGVNGHLSVYGTAPSMPDYEKLSTQVAKLPGVLKVTPIIEGQVMASANGQAGGALVRGIAPADLAKRPIIADNIVIGGLKDFRGKDGVLIGTRLARNLGLRVGDKITLISPKGNITAFGTVPRMRAYRVAGLFNVGMHEYDSSFIFMPLPAAQIYFKLPKAVNYLDVVIDDPDAARAMAGAVFRALGGKGQVLDWQRKNSSFFNAIQVERNVMFLILTLIIVVAAFNIISSLIMLVKDKGRDIAILRTMGATRGMIMRVFFLSGASVGVIGTFFGLGLGLAFAENIETIRQWLQGLTGTELFAAEIYFLSHLPAIVDPGEVTAVVLMGLGLSILATIYPSWRAARLDPVEALRYE